MPALIDIIIYPAGMLISAYLVLRYSWVGVVAGFFQFWLTPYFWGSTLSAFDPARSIVLDHFWFTVGWIICIGWCGAAFACRNYLQHESVPLRVFRN